MSDTSEDKQFLVYANVKMRGAWMTITAATEEAARAKAEAEPDFECGGAELVDWTVTSVEEAP